MIGPAGKYRGRASAARDNKAQGEIGDNGYRRRGAWMIYPGKENQRCRLARQGRGVQRQKGKERGFSDREALAPFEELPLLFQVETGQHHFVHFARAIDKPGLTGVAVDPLQ